MNAVVCCATTAFALVLLLSAAQADVTISTAATQNMSCSNGVCAPTASNAVLNVSDLENLLVSGNVEVTTSGSGVQAENIDVTGAFGWSNGSALSLDAYQSIAFSNAVSVTGQGGLSLTTNDGGSNGTLTFGLTGSASFQNLSSALTINGVSYTLVNSITALANAIANNPAGNFALAASYDASQDGTYKDSPIATELTGTVQGLGNTISNLSIDHPRERRTNDLTALFTETGSSATVASVRMSGFNIKAHQTEHTSNGVGSLVALSQGILFDDHVSGTLRTHHTGVGGLAAGQDGGTILWCSANVKISTSGFAGGLVGSLGGGSVIEQSYSTGTVNGSTRAGLGGLVVNLYGGVYDSYSTAAVTGGDQSTVGGLIAGDEQGGIVDSYASGAVSGGLSSLVGGLVGNYFPGVTTDNYWDTTTSGTDDGISGGNASGITGLTSKKFRKGLPSGFDPSIWVQQKGINHGLPYLIANPPPAK